MIKFDTHSAGLTFYATPEKRIKAYLIIADYNDIKAILNPGNRISVDGVLDSLPSGDHGELIFVNARKRLAELGWRPVSRFKSDSYRRDMFSVDLRPRNTTIVTGGDLTGHDFTGADLVGEALQSAVLVRACFVRAQLDYADLSSANLSDADLRDASLNGTDLRGARLCGANLSRCVTGGDTTFKNADLSRAVVRDVKLDGVVSGTSFRDADLQGSELTGVIAGADFSGVDLQGTTIVKTSVSGSNFGTATLPPLAELVDVSWTPETVWPEHLRQEILNRSIHLRGPALNGSDGDLYELNPTADRRHLFGSAPAQARQRRRPRSSGGFLARWRRS